jgi:hypothetical protein
MSEILAQAIRPPQIVGAISEACALFAPASFDSLPASREYR